MITVLRIDVAMLSLLKVGPFFCAGSSREFHKKSVSNTHFLEKKNSPMRIKVSVSAAGKPIRECREPAQRKRNL